MSVITEAVVRDALPSAARTASGDAALASIPVGARLRCQLNVTAASGVTPTLDVVIEDTLDGTNWNAVATFTQRTAAGRQVLDITNPIVSNSLRVRWSLTGTNPSFTFGLKVVAL